MHSVTKIAERLVQIPIGSLRLDGDLTLTESATGLVLFAHGSGSSRHSPRSRFVAGALHSAGLATLLFDLLTAREEAEDTYSGYLGFDIDMLAQRLMGATDWVTGEAATKELAVGYFGASTGAAAALVAAARRASVIRAVVSRGGRPDLADAALARVRAPTLLIVGSSDTPVVGMNQQALAQLGAKQKQLVLVPGATHLFEEPGALEEVAHLAADWFAHHLSTARASSDA